MRPVCEHPDNRPLSGAQLCMDKHSVRQLPHSTALSYLIYFSPFIHLLNNKYNR